MDKKLADQIIGLLQQGKDIPAEYQDILFPIDHLEYELTYKGKKKRQAILSSANEPQSVPFQIQKQFGQPNEWNNLLIFGDNFQILKTMYENKDELIKDKVKGKVKLIYIDPPFATADEFSNKQGAKAYSDKVKGAEFLEFLRQRLILSRELLADDGSIYVHLDSKMCHYVKVIMDEVFGKNNFQREIIWDISVLSGFKTLAPNWIRGHDTILYYSKSENRIFNKLLQPHTEKYLAMFNRTDADGRKYLIAHGTKRYLDDVEKKGKPFGDVWGDIMSFQQQPTSAEKVDYPTQKPTSLLERIIKASTNENDLVMDFFAGSGTTLVVAEKLNRRWIGCDIGKLAIYTIQKRLLTEKKCKPFALVNAAIYDLTEVFCLDKIKYDTFVKNLFHIDSEKKTVGGVTFDGKRRGDWAKIFDFHYFKGNPAIDEKYIEDLHKLVGKKVGNKIYLVAPEMNINVFDDYIELNGVRYYLLRIPYQAIKELHKAAFKKPQQPKNKANINNVETSVGFYFNEEPEVKSMIRTIENKVIIDIESVKPQYENSTMSNDILAMVLLDTTTGSEFVMQKCFFADEIVSKQKGFQYQIELSKKDLKSNKVRIIYIDIFGNEFTETLEVK